MSLKYKPVTQSILCLIFLMYVIVKMIQCLHNSGQSFKHDLQFLILKHLWVWPWNKVKVIKTGYKLVDPKQGYNYIVWKTSLEQCLSNSQQYSFCQISKHVHYLPWMYAKVKHIGIFMTCSMHKTLQKSQLTNKNIKFSDKIV